MSYSIKFGLWTAGAWCASWASYRLKRWSDRCACSARCSLRRRDALFPSCMKRNPSFDCILAHECVTASVAMDVAGRPAGARASCLELPAKPLIGEGHVQRRQLRQERIRSKASKGFARQRHTW